MLHADELAAAVRDAFALSSAQTEFEPAAADTEGFADWQILSAAVAAVARALGSRVIGISGSQGSGKSTLAHTLTATLTDQQLAASAVSIDDFYLTREARAKLAREVHPLLRTRGVPGTHDWQWLARTLAAVHAGESPLHLPRFDKGLDDRSGTQEVRADLLIVEGWCMGVTPQPAAALTAPCNDLEAEEDTQAIWRSWVNRQVEAHYAPLWADVDLWVHLRVPGFAQVLEWRTQQEQQVPPEQRMDAAGVARFVQHYERLTRWMWQQPARGPGFVVTLDHAHEVAAFAVANAPHIQ